MKRFLSPCIAFIVAVSCQTGHDRPADSLSRVVETMGGGDALSNVKTIWVKGTVREWEPEQSIVADGDPRLASDSTFEALTDTGSGASRIDWVRNFSYPQVRSYTFSEIVTPEAGYVSGIDATARNKQNLESNPPAHTMSGLRLAATQRELRRTSPLLLSEMLKNRGQVTPVADVLISGVAYAAVDYKAGDQTLTVMFDRTSGLPVRIRTLDYDNIWGDVTYDLVLADWRTIDKLPIAFSRKYELNGRVVADITLTEVKTNAPASPERFEIPAALKASAAKPATGNVPFQWVLRRQFIGTYLDSDQPSYDTRAVKGLRLSEVAPGVQQVVGGTHNALIVAMRDHLIVFDAPISDWQSNWTLAAAHEKYPGKPVKYLVLIHHHMDHSGGLRAYAAQGATLVVGKGNAEHFRRVLAAPFQRNPDLAPRDLSKTEVIEVTDRRVLTDGKREVILQLMDNPHAAGMLLGYVADARLGWVDDLWSPGRDALPPKLNPGQAALVAAVKKAGISPAKFAAGHGSSGDYLSLAALGDKK